MGQSSGDTDPGAAADDAATVASQRQVKMVEVR
jgi:hypothetical protein